MTSWHELRSMYEEYEEPQWAARLRCPSCGGFLPNLPTHTEKFELPTMEWQQNADGEWVDVAVNSGQIEERSYWHCKKCGKTHEENEVMP